jgi:hypothetical protein
LAGIGPGGQPGDNVELPEEPADDLVGIGLGTEAVELTNDFHEGLLDVVNRALRIELALLFQAALSLDELFTVKI